MFPLSIQIYFELAALLTSVIFWSKIKKTWARWLLPFLLFIVLVELTGRYIRLELYKPNAWIYNISVPIEYLFYGFIFYLNYTRKTFKVIALVFLIAFPVFVLANMLFVQGFFRFNTNILKIGSFCMIILCCFYFTELMAKSEEIKLLTEPLFWLATGIFLFNAGEFFYSLFTDYLIQNHLDRTRKLFKSINNKLLWVLYTCIIISVICMARKRQKA